MSSAVQVNSGLTVEDVKFLVAVLDYSLYACPVDGGIDKGDGTSATREDFENVQKKLKDLLISLTGR